MLSGDNLAKAQELARWRRRLAQSWSQVRVESVEAHGSDGLEVGGRLDGKARVNLGSLSPDDVEGQLFHGVGDSLGEIPAPHTAIMSHNGNHEGSSWHFNGTIPCRSSGQHGYAVRVVPKHLALANPFETGLVTWG